MSRKINFTNFGNKIFISCDCRWLTYFDIIAAITKQKTQKFWPKRRWIDGSIETPCTCTLSHVFGTWLTLFRFVRVRCYHWKNEKVLDVVIMASEDNVYACTKYSVLVCHTYFKINLPIKLSVLSKSKGFQSRNIKNGILNRTTR